MNAIPAGKDFPKAFNLPYQMGLFLAANAVSDVCLVLDGLNCVMSKADFLAGNHDLNSTLFSPSGAHRLICTMYGPLPQKDNPDKALAALLNGVAGSGRFAAVLVTGLPFLKLAGMDYEGLAAGVRGGAPVADVPPVSMDSDWLDGYDLALDALARALPASGRRRKRSVAIAGYMMDRNEADHAANLNELRRLLELCGLELACVFPSGETFRELSRALEADLVISLPYGRRAARRLAGRSGAKLIETGLPLGLAGTARWLEAVRGAAGLKGPLPPEVRKLEREAAADLAPALGALLHRNIVYAGDPHFFAAFSAFARELGMRPQLALIDSFPRPLGTARLPPALLFSPDAAEAAAALAGMKGHKGPDIVIGNSFARTEGLADGLPFAEIGFPSYGHHCLSAEPFLGFAGARTLAGRLFNALRSAPLPGR